MTDIMTVRALFKQSSATGRAGVWLITGQASISNDADGYRLIYFDIGGTQIIGKSQIFPAQGSTTRVQANAIYRTAVATDILRMRVVHTAGNNEIIYAGDDDTWMSCVWLGE